MHISVDSVQKQAGLFLCTATSVKKLYTKQKLRIRTCLEQTGSLFRWSSCFDLYIVLHKWETIYSSRVFYIKHQYLAYGYRDWAKERLQLTENLAPKADDPARLWYYVLFPIASSGVAAHTLAVVTNLAKYRVQNYVVFVLTLKNRPVLSTEYNTFLDTCGMVVWSIYTCIVCPFAYRLYRNLGQICNVHDS